MDLALVLRTSSYLGMLAVMLGFEWPTPYYTAGSALPNHLVCDFLPVHQPCLEKGSVDGSKNIFVNFPIDILIIPNRSLTFVMSGTIN